MLGGSQRRALTAIALLAGLALAGCGGGAEAGSMATPTLNAQELAGKRAFERMCASCHSTLPEVVIVGPSLAGIGERAGTRVAGMEPRAYLTQSITDPSAYLVEDYRDLMPQGLETQLGPGELENVVSYLLTLE